MSKAPLVLLEAGYQTWRILGPTVLYGDKLTSLNAPEDRRYEELAVVHGRLDVALQRLFELERGRG